jgi:iron complex transport system ATP-binding protein
LDLPPNTTLGLMTPVDVSKYQACVKSLGGVRVVALTTVGLYNALGVAEKPDAHHAASTVNLIVYLDCAAEPQALVNTFQTAVEAKCSALMSADIRSAVGGRHAVGTSTDTTTVISGGTGRTFEYAGTATLLGYLVGAAATCCIQKCLRADRLVGRDVLRRLGEGCAP